MRTLRALELGTWLVRSVPAPLLRPLPYPIGFVIYLLASGNRRTIIANQRQVLGPVGPLRLHWQALRVMINLIHSYHLLVRLRLLTDEQIRRTVVLRGEGELAAAVARGRGAIILGAHIAGFNVLAPFASLLGQPAGAFVEPVEPPELFDFVSGIRARTGLELLLPDRDGATGALRLLRRNGLLLIAADRYLGTNGARVPFFGRPAYLPLGPVVLAQRNDTPLLPTTLRRLPDGRFLAEIHPPLALADTGDRRADLDANMRLVAGALERTIGGAAEQWLLYAPVWELRPGDDPTSPPPAAPPARLSRLRRWLRPRRAHPEHDCPP